MKKPISNSRIRTLLKVIEWLLFIGFCVLAIYFMNNVWDQFQAKESSLGQSLKPIKKLPTLTICYYSLYNWMEYVDIGYTAKAKKSEPYQALKLGEKYYIPQANETIEIVRFNAHCIKINSTLTSTLEKMSKRGLSIYFKNMTKEESDASVFVFFTSEENSYGAESLGENLHSKNKSNFSLILYKFDFQINN